ncbi:hypothetical protein A0H81_06717 [Grifola frondosa]|uniref:Bromo domain-containing protein n=1 Tax=Grifola frondosa TaxID=5627 RepID=A0A1C7M7N4_GRIFR|nr:hypothetical protein A0H81_06717 [Grifola frondosa]
MSETDFPSYHHAESSHYDGKGTSSSSGLKFVLPPLSSVKALKGKKKLKLVHDEGVKKIPRPIKLKPLKEVLTKLITQIKKKDDYAFFLEPVDPAHVPGYADVVKRPMDLGTMTTKVKRGKYRSLEEFASDIRLLATNAKTFNPPGTIYHAEADKIETYALDHIAKAAASVIEYETDWNIEIENDEEPVAVDDEDTGDKGTPMDVDEARAVSPSVASTQAQPTQHAGGRRARAKKQPGTLTESLERDGGLPGAKDGLGAFPPGSDWADLMLALKLKGKRYRTKKERLRMEKGGPPYAADGSLDYTEMEDPFSVLSFFVPEPPSRPLLTPLFPTLPPSDPSEPPFPAPVNIPPSSTPPPVPTLSSNKHPKLKTKPRRRHWTIVRNPPGRGRAKDKEDEESEPQWRTPREPVATDFGSYATLTSTLAQERGFVDVGTELGSEEKVFKAVRESIEGRPAKRQKVEDAPIRSADDYWRGKIGDAEEYIRDVVYGGVDGLAYIRSLAEFVTPSEPMKSDGEPPTYDALGMPLAQWVYRAIVDPLTGGRHRTLCEAAQRLHHPASSAKPDPDCDPSVDAQIDLSLNTYPQAAQQLIALRQIAAAPIDMGALIRAPDELFLAEDSWAGAELKAQRRREAEAARERALVESPAENAAAYLAFAIQSHREAEAGPQVVSAFDDREVLEHALRCAAEEIDALARKTETPVKAEGEAAAEESAEDALMKRLRLNLLALAKRAPLDQITKLPTELVPPHLRHIVPTIGC